MNVRTVEKAVTFRFPFRLASLEITLPAGTYRLAMDEEEIAGTDVFHDASVSAVRRVAAVLHVPAITAPQTNAKVLWIDPEELDFAIAADAEIDRDLAPHVEPAAAVSMPLAAPVSDEPRGATPGRSFLRRYLPWSSWN